MSDSALPISETLVASEPPAQAGAATKSFLGHAKLIGGLTFVSRIIGLAHEVVAGHFLGTGIVASAFTVAFTIPNLFRKLLGEGALSAAFIPLYAQATRRGTTESGETAADFASASVNLLVLILLGITLVGEAILITLIFTSPGSGIGRLLMLKFAAVMLPYVMLVCSGAFLSAILQVHHRFGPPAFMPILLNACHITVVLGGAIFLGLHGRDPLTPRVEQLQARLALWVSFAVLVSGVLQVAILLPALKQIGFRFRPRMNIWSPAVKKMLVLSVPVALGAGVLQLSVLFDKGLSYALMQGEDPSHQLITHFHWFGHLIRYPMELGATRRLDLAQLLYQFPLGVFAIALATAIFPNLSADALDKDRERFQRVMRQGIEATLWEGFPASIGLILVAEPAAQAALPARADQRPRCNADRALDRDLCRRDLGFFIAPDHQPRLLRRARHRHAAGHVDRQYRREPHRRNSPPLVARRSGHGHGDARQLRDSSRHHALYARPSRRRTWAQANRPARAQDVRRGDHHGRLFDCRSALRPLSAWHRRIVWASQLGLMLAAGAGVYFAASHFMGLETFRQLMPRRKS